MDDHNPTLCLVGGAVKRGHDRVRDWLADWIASQTGEPVQTEQIVPA